MEIVTVNIEMDMVGYIGLVWVPHNIVVLEDLQLCKDHVDSIYLHIVMIVGSSNTPDEEGHTEEVRCVFISLGASSKSGVVTQSQKA